jgi:hypothetical protein
MGPEFSQVGTNMVTSYIMNTYSQTVTATTSDPSTWNNTISVDEIRQTNSPPQTPSSDSYLSGAPPKRRKVRINFVYPTRRLIQDSRATFYIKD